MRSTARGGRRRTGLRASADARPTPAQAASPPRAKGRHAADDAAIRERATDGANVYSHEDWARAVEQLHPHEEFDYDAAVEGEVPRELNGTLYRNGPGKYQRGATRYAHFLDGDGLVLSFDFDVDKNKARARARFVRTEEFVEEEEADEVLYRGTFGTPKPGGVLRSLGDLRTKNLANTHVISWGGRVHALYEAGVPYELDPVTLATLCQDDLDACLPSMGGLFVSSSVDLLDSLGGLGGWAFTAHPHVDPRNARLCGWAWQSIAATNQLNVRFAEWDTEWNRVASRKHVLGDCAAAPHDFGVTQTRYVMFQNRLDLEAVPYVLGMKAAANVLVSRPDLPVLVHVVPRPTGIDDAESAAASDAVCTAVGPKESFEIHVCFAHDGAPIDGTDADAGDDDSHLVTAYTAGWDKLNPGSFLSEWGAEGDLAPDFDKIPRTVLWRYVIDTRTGDVKRTLAPGCEGVCLDHPHVNPRFEGSAACRYVWATITNEVETSGPPRGYVRLDLKEGTRDVWYAPSGKLFCEEPVVVEKEVSKGHAEDLGECWVLGMCTDVDDGGRSSLLIFDGAALSLGPVCRVRLSHHVTHGLHGSFASRA